MHEIQTATVSELSAWPRLRRHSMDRLRRYGTVSAFYAAVMYFTQAYYMGDTVHYADMIQDSTAMVLSDFGHLLWLVLGRLLRDAAYSLTGVDDRAIVILMLITVTWIAGLLSALIVYDLALRVSRRAWLSSCVTAVFIFSQGFLNFAHTGCAYVLGLSLLLLGLWLLFREEDKTIHSPAGGVPAGTAFACAVAVWFPYILAIPGMLASTLLVFGWKGWRLRYIARAVVGFLIASTVFYGSAAALQNIYTPRGFLNWMSASSHGITTGGFTRMVFGFARSFINMGNDGVLFKRFLLHDPFNPVSLLDLLRVSLGKFLLFYIVVGILLVALARSAQGRRFLGFLSFTALPVVTFASFWQGGDMERYFPLYPAIFLSLAYALSEGPWMLIVRSAIAVFLPLMIFINQDALGGHIAEQRQTRALARVGEIQQLWKPNSRIATVLMQDEVFMFHWDYPLHPANRTGIFARPRDKVPAVLDIVDRNGPFAPQWRAIFATETLAVWSRGGDLWISKEAFAPRPWPSSAWVEGDDPRVPWRDVNAFFSKFETDRSMGDSDGFFLLPSSLRNRELLTAEVAANKRAALTE
jgi:hypothetical protein